jgi:hypothetical protein
LPFKEVAGVMQGVQPRNSLQSMRKEVGEMELNLKVSETHLHLKAPGSKERTRKPGRTPALASMLSMLG